MVSSIHGPDEQVSIGGAAVLSIVPLVSAETGNVTVSFDVLSYAGTLTITAVADPDAVPDLPDLIAALRSELAALTATTEPGQHRSRTEDVPWPEHPPA
jgi:diacylglycerol O-acyltransferase / wax synthase